MFKQVKSTPAWTRAPQPRPGGFRQVNAANAYAKAMLKKLAAKGYTASSLGIHGNAAAQWRAISPIAGALAAAHAGTAYHSNPHAPVNSAVAQVLAQLVGAAPPPSQLVNPPVAPPMAPPPQASLVPTSFLDWQHGAGGISGIG